MEHGGEYGERMAIGRISGPLLKANLLRNGVDLAFETNLLYLDVINGRIGIKTTTPSNELQVVGTTRTTNLEVTNQSDLATFTVLGNTISSSSSTINLVPFGTNPVVYQGTIVTGNLQLSTNLIETTGTNTDLQITTTGSGKVKIGTALHNTDVLVTGNIHATGNITADGDITIGDANTDNITFNADIDSNFNPNVDNFYDLGTDPGTLAGSNPLATGRAWKTAYVHDVITSSVQADQIIVNGIDLRLPQGNIYYVAENGNDANAGVHENNPLATVKHALSLAGSGDTVYIYAGTYTEVFPLTVPAGVTVRGAGIRAVKIVPSVATKYNDAFLLNGETTVEDLSIADFFSGGNYFTVTAASAGSTTVNVGTAPFAHSFVNGGTITIGATSYNITNAVYTYTTGVLVLTHTGGTATLGSSVFVSKLTFSCNGSQRVFPDNGYAFRFADNFTVTSRSPYIRNCTVITKGSTTSPSDPNGFNSGDAGKGAYIDGAYANSASKEASMLFHSVTFITPNVDTITAKNGVRIEWLNSFTYFANRGIYALSSNYGFAQQGKTRLRIDTRSGTWNTGNTVKYYDTNGTTVLATGTISSIDGNYVNLTGRCLGFETITDRLGKTVYANGDAKLSTAQKKFGTASLSLDGTGDYVTVPSTPDFAFGTGAWCLEAWIYNTANPLANQILFDFRTVSPSWAPTFFLQAVTSTVKFVANGTTLIETVATIPLNTWTHVALACDGTSTRIFINGTQSGSTYTDNNTYIQGPLTLGARFDGTTPFFGYIDDVRISKGVARYTSTFAAPTSALTGDLNTVLLLHFNGTNNSTVFLDDGVTLQDLRVTNGGPTIGTATLINFADYSDFGAEIRSIGSANVYGNYGIYGDGPGVIAYLISQNFAYVGTGKLSSNDPNDRIAANEVVKLNNAKIYYTSVDNEGNFKVGDSFYVNQKTGEVLFNNQSLSITAPQGVIFSDGVNTTTILPTNIDTGNIRISGNTIESLTGNVNVTSASGSINLQNNTYITGNLDVTGNVTIGGNIQIGDNVLDNIDFVGGINSDVIPAATATWNLGSVSPTALRWKNIYLNRAEVDGLVIDANTISTTISNDDLILTAAGSGRIYVPSNNVLIDQNLTVNGTAYVNYLNVTHTLTSDVFTTGDIQIDNNVITTTLTNSDLVLIADGAGKIYVPSNDVLINQKLTVVGLTTTSDINVGTLLNPATITHIGNVVQTGTVTQTGDYHLTGNLTVDGLVAQFEDIKLDSNLLTTTQTNSDLDIVANGNGKVYIPSNNVQIDQNLTVNGTSYIDTLSVTNTITSDVFTTGDIEIYDNIITTTLASSDLILSANNTGRIYVPSNNVLIDQQLTVNGLTTTTNINVGTALNNATITHIGNVTQTGDVTQTGNYHLTGNLTVDGIKTQFENIKIESNLLATTVSNTDLELVANGTGRIYIPSNNVQVDQNLTVTQDLTVTTGLTTLKDVGITGTITQIGNITQTGNFTTSGDTTVTGNITGSGYLQLPVITISGNTIQTTVTNTDLQLNANGSGNVIFEGLKVQDNNIQSTVTNSNITLTPQGTGSVVINSNQSLIIPVGTTAERPASATNGMIRYNTSTSRYEGRANGYWTKLGGVEDISGNTRILPEATPGANDNTLYFYANNQLMVTIDSTKLFAQRVHTSQLDIYDNTITTLTSDTDINMTTTGTGSVHVGNLKIRNNTITNIVYGAVTEFIQTGTGYVKIGGTGGVVIPSGDSLNDRPSVRETGMMRFNTELQLVEVWTGLIWTSVAGLASGITVSDATDLGIQAALTLG